LQDRVRQRQHREFVGREDQLALFCRNFGLPLDERIMSSMSLARAVLARPRCYDASARPLSPAGRSQRSLTTT